MKITKKKPQTHEEHRARQRYSAGAAMLIGLPRQADPPNTVRALFSAGFAGFAVIRFSLSFCGSVAFAFVGFVPS